MARRRSSGGQPAQPGHVRFGAVGDRKAGDPQQLEHVRRVLGDHRGLVEAHDEHLPGFGKQVGGAVEPLQCVLADRLLKAQGVGLERTGEDIFLDREAQLVVVHDRSGRGAQPVFVPGRLLQFGIAGETERLRKPHHRRTRRGALATEFLRAQVADLFEVVDDVAGDRLLRAGKAVETFPQQIAHSPWSCVVQLHSKHAGELHRLRLYNGCCNHPALSSGAAGDSFSRTSDEGGGRCLPTGAAGRKKRRRTRGAAAPLMRSAAVSPLRVGRLAGLDFGHDLLDQLRRALLRSDRTRW